MPTTMYSGYNMMPSMYSAGLYNTGLWNTGLWNTGLTHIVKRDAEAWRGGWGGRSYGGYGRSYGGYGRGRWGKREAEADPAVIINSGLRTVMPTTMYSGLRTIMPTTMYSGINTYSTGLFNTGLWNTGLTHYVKRDADAEPEANWGWSGRSYGGRWGYGRGYSSWGNRGWSGRSWGRGYGWGW